jgi:hypothetical protein
VAQQLSELILVNRLHFAADNDAICRRRSSSSSLHDWATGVSALSVPSATADSFDAARSYRLPRRVPQAGHHSASVPRMASIDESSSRWCVHAWRPREISDGVDDELCPLDGYGPVAFGGGCAVGDDVPFSGLVTGCGIRSLQLPRA